MSSCDLAVRQVGFKHIGGIGFRLQARPFGKSNSELGFEGAVRQEGRIGFGKAAARI